MCSQTCVSTVCPFMTVFANLMWGTVSGKLNTSYHGAVFSPYKEGVALIHSSSVHSVIFFQDLFYFYDCYACLMYMQHVFAWCPRRSEEHPQILWNWSCDMDGFESLSRYWEPNLDLCNSNMFIHSFLRHLYIYIFFCKEPWLPFSIQPITGSTQRTDTEVWVNPGLCCGIIHLYTVNIYCSCWFNKEPTGQ